MHTLSFQDFLPGYLSSSLHIKYLSELINTVKTSIELLGRKKRSGNCFSLLVHGHACRVIILPLLV